MSDFRIGGAFADVIRCDEPTYLIWKWHPKGTQGGDNYRENAIRRFSSLRVKDGEVAVLVYSIKREEKQEFIEGPFDKSIKTLNLPFLSRVIGLGYRGESPFQAEIYFINLARIVQVKFGVPYFDVYDPRFLDFGVPVAVRGTISFKITDYRAFVKLHRLNSFTLEDFQSQIRDAVARYVKDVVANAPKENGIPVVQIETRTAQINDVVEKSIKDRLFEEFGVDVSGVDIGAIEIDKTSENYRDLMKVTKEATVVKVEADKLDYVESLRIQRQEGQYALHKQTQTANIGAFQTEKNAEVGIAGASALGKMGENGVGSVNLNGGSGFNPVSMMAGMTLGGAVGQNLAQTMNTALSGKNPTPPPIPTAMYYLAINGQPAGPYSIGALRQMISSGEFTAETLAWRSGMDDWQLPGEIDELKPLFPKIPPIPNK